MYTIGKLAKRAQVSADSVRFYERQGLIGAAQKTNAGYRLYTDEALSRLAFIKLAQRCGFSLAEVRALFELRARAAAPQAERLRLVLDKQAQIEETMTALREMSETLSNLITVQHGQEETATGFTEEIPALRAAA